MHALTLVSALLVGLLVCAPSSYAADEPATAPQERRVEGMDAAKLDELGICQSRLATLRDQVRQCAPISANSSVREAWQRYASTYYDQQTRLQEVRVRLFGWQIFAANCVLGLVALLSISGVAFAGYQLWTAARMATAAGSSTELEISSQKVRIQTSIVGIVVLVISGVFLLMFLRDVYNIEEIGSGAHIGTNAEMPGSSQ